MFKYSKSIQNMSKELLHVKFYKGQQEKTTANIILVVRTECFPGRNEARISTSM